MDEERCHVCHNREDDLERYSDTDFVHTNHITKHKVDCLHCHTTVEQSLQPYETVAKLGCEDCHPEHHDKVCELYMAKEVKGLPKLGKSTHFMARVTCQTCHVAQESEEGKVGDIRRASQKVCVECHREGYDKMFDNWHWAFNGYTDRLGKLREMTKKAVAKPGEDLDEDDVEEAKDYFAEGNRLFAFVEQAIGAHNVGNAKKLLFSAQEALQESMSLLSEDYLPKNELRMLETDIEPGCTFNCHTGIERMEKAKYQDKDFKHAEHITKHELTCTKCHADEKDYTKKHGKAQMDMKDQLCLDCHEKEKKKKAPAEE